MKWKEGSEKKTGAKESDLDYLDDDETYSSLRTNSQDSLPSIISSLLKPSSLVIGATVLILILALALLIPKKGSHSIEKQNKEIEASLKQLEARLVNIESRPAAPVKTEDQTQNIERLKTRLDRLEKTLTVRIDDLAKEMKKSGAKPAAAPPAKASSQAPEPATKKAKVAAPRSHTVQAGDTFFSIARRYGISVETLRKINKLTPDQTIHPGDILIVEER